MNARAGDTYTDANGRTLTITEVNPGAKDGREIIGRITAPYSCSEDIFDHVWWKKEVTPPPHRMKTG